MENNGRLNLARFLAAVTVIITILNYARIVIVDANIPPHGCGTLLVGMAMLQCLLLIVSVVCVIYWAYVEYQESDDDHVFFRIMIPIAIALIIPALINHSVYSDPNMAINQKEPMDKENYYGYEYDRIEEEMEKEDSLTNEKDTLAKIQKFYYEK